MLTIENIHIHLGESAALTAALRRAEEPEVGAEVSAIALAIGQRWPGVDGVYAGVSRGEGNQPDAHLVLLDERPAQAMSWNDAMRLTESRDDGARLPTRFESALLYAHLREHFDDNAWHWTSTQSSEATAWYQDFNHGNQLSTIKKFEARVRLVRRFPL